MRQSSTSKTYHRNPRAYYDDSSSEEEPSKSYSGQKYSLLDKLPSGTKEIIPNKLYLYASRQNPRQLSGVTLINTDNDRTYEYDGYNEDFGPLTLS
jgi:hypothetical protein